MTIATYHDPSRREILAGLMTRLQRVEAAGGSLKSLAGMHETSATMLTDALEALGRDLLLAMRETESARERIRR
jgi:hypothetical protein